MPVLFELESTAAAGNACDAFAEPGTTTYDTFEMSKDSIHAWGMTLQESESMSYEQWARLLGELRDAVPRE